MMKRIFDIDGTLMDSSVVQEYCIACLKLGLDVMILTSRYSGLKEKGFVNLDGIDLHNRQQFNGDYYLVDQWKDVYALAEELGIDLDNVYFTEGVYKAKWFAAHGYDDFILIDDSPQEVEQVNLYVSRKKFFNVKAVMVGNITKLYSHNRT